MTNKLSGASSPLTLIFFFLFCTPSLASIPNLPGSAFTHNHGFQAAVDAAPIWLFGRSLNRNPCYPDVATINGGNNPNPGTGLPAGPFGPDPNPGNCRTPGPYNGIYSPGGSFPNYINTVYCTAQDEWRVTYSLYYVHDGVLSLGHRNDWESATVVWGRAAGGSNYWYRKSFILSRNDGTGYDSYSWNNIESVNVPTDQDKTTGQNKKHPKVYVGFFKHANFPNGNTNSNLYNPFLPSNEFRSHDWYFLPHMGDMHASSEIYSGWNYGAAGSSSPATIDPCSF